MEQKLFSKDFLLVVIGQMISLFGNAALRFALPLHLLHETGSSAVYGAVTACAFFPAILLSPLGGIIADRVNKRNIMVILDFLTACVILGFLLLEGKGNLILLLTATLMLFYGIAGVYQPSVQASVPALVGQKNLMAANSIVNMVNSLSSLLGPVLGGILYSAYGLETILVICLICFFLSALMELFIKIPFTARESKQRIWKMVRDDFAESIRFIWKEKPEIGKGLLAVSGINLFLSAMLTVGMPYLITDVMGFLAGQSGRLYGFLEGALAAGGLLGGVCAGVFAKRLKVCRAGGLLSACAFCVFPMGIALAILPSKYAVYSIMIICCFLIAALSSVFTVLMMAFIQAETEERLIGKVIAVILTVSMCAQPVGNAVYGLLFELCRNFEYAVILLSGAASLAVAAGTRKVFENIE